MSAGTDMFGDIAELATALGILGPGGQISTAFFVDPAAAIGGTSGKDLLRAASLRDGMDASPVATTHWTQPWVPMFLEWTLALRADETLASWTLADTDVHPAAGTSGDPGDAGQLREYSGRTLLTSVAARTFAAQVLAFVNDEDARGPASAVLRPDEEDSLAAVAAAGFTLDALSGTLADLHPQLLGLTWADSSRSHRDPDGTPILPGRPRAGPGGAATAAAPAHPSGADVARLRRRVGARRRGACARHG